MLLAYYRCKWLRLDVRSLRKSHPQNEDKLEGVVEREPVHRVDGALEDRQEGVDDPVGQPLI